METGKLVTALRYRDYSEQGTCSITVAHNIPGVFSSLLIHHIY